MRKTTRSLDLEILEQGRDNGNKSAEKSLEKAYIRSKDPYLEKMRYALVEAHKRLDNYEINRIEEIIREYGKQSNF